MPVLGQNSQGTILGHVEDSTGSLVSGAKVTARNIHTNVSTAFTTNTSGDYVFAKLVPGAYELSVQAKGFKTAQSSGLILEVDQTLRQDFALSIGEVTESVTVLANTQMVQTDNTTTGNVLPDNLIQELPSNGRDFTNLINLNAGASNINGGIQSTGFVLHGLSSFISTGLNGARPDSVSYLIDGVQDNDTVFGGISNVPSEYALQEVKVQSGLYSAEYGQGSAQVNVAIKSGTNAWHGNLYDYIQNDAFQPKSPVNNALNVLSPPDPGTPPLPLKNPFKQNQFGGTIGGPVTVPWLYSGKDKTFWFFAFDGGRRSQRQPAPDGIQLPTLAERNGDFSDWPFPLYDPATSGMAPVVPCTSPNVACNPLGRLTFPGNKIPASRMNAIGQNILKLYPAPNINCAMPCNNFRVPISNTIETNTGTMRVDQNFANDRIFFTGNVRTDDEPNPNQLPFTGSISSTHAQLFGVNWEHLFGSNMINDVRIGYNHQFFNTGLVTAFGADLSSQLGLQNTTFNPALFGIPQIQLENNYATIGTNNAGYSTKHTAWQFVDNLSIVHGKHTFIVGFDIRRLREFEADNFGGIGTLSFNGAYTAADAGDTLGALGGSPGINFGNAAADALLGYPIGAGAPPPLGNDELDVRGVNWNFFAQDNWRVTPKLTLNLGLRYEIPPDFHSVDNSGFTLNPANGGSLIWVNRATVQGLTTAQSTPSFLTCCARNTLVPIDKTNFAPRIGVSWRPFSTDRFVVRAGYGLFYDTYERFLDFVQSFDSDKLASLISNPNYPTASGTEAASPLALSTLWLPPVPGAAFFNSPSWDPGLGGTIYNQTEWPGNHNPYIQQWTLDTQYALTQNLLLDVGYVGSHDIHLPSQVLLNAAAPPRVANDSCNYTFDISQATPACLADPNFVPIDKRVPFPGLPSVVYANANVLSANYHALQTQLRQRFSHGLQYQVFYTYSKAMDMNSAINNVGGTSDFIQDPHNVKADYGRAGFDQTHRLVTSATYELPVGQGKRWSFGPANWVLGGWRMSGIYTLTSGRTFSIYAPQNAQFFDQMGSALTGRYRANQSGDPNAGFSQTTQEWFNTNVFSSPLPGTYGNSRKGTLRGPYFEDLDMSFSKSFAIHENHKLEYRLDIFNMGSNWHSVARIPDNNIQDNNFGWLYSKDAVLTPNGVANYQLWTPRKIQMGLVYSF
jgi:hypothetical protein